MINIIHSLPMPVLVIGADERVAAANQAVELVFGRHIVGRHYVSVIRQPGLIKAVGDARREAGTRMARFTNRESAKDTAFHVAVTAAADDHIVMTFEDRTAAEDANQMRRDFVANVSHELRTPLTALLGFIETLGGAAREDQKARDRFLGIMAHEANRMTRLVDDLLSLSRVEEDERVRPREHVDLGALLESVIKGLEPQARDAGVTVTLAIDGADQMVPGDAGQLVQVFTNLVENGIKYGVAGKAVDVTLSQHQMNQRLRGDAVQVSVTDKGEGIASHHIARVTERFYRVDSHRSREVGGTGLGLAIVKHIINRHRGYLQIESEEGAGTQISVFLPTSALS